MNKSVKFCRKSWEPKSLLANPLFTSLTSSYESKMTFLQKSRILLPHSAIQKDGKSGLTSLYVTLIQNLTKNLSDMTFQTSKLSKMLFLLDLNLFM